MKKIFKWAGIVLGTFLVLVLVAYAYMHYQTKSRFDKQYAVQAQAITIPTDQASLELGKHQVNIKGCRDCHGTDLGGNVVIDDPGLGSLPAPNITTGKGGLLSRHKTYSDLDYLLAIKHGIGKDKKSLKLMPSYEYAALSQKDMGALIAYLKSVPPVDREMPAIALKPLTSVLVHLDKLPLVSAERVDHQAISPKVVHPEVSRSYGQYLAVSCTGCHRDSYKGGDALIPGSPPVPDITAAGSVGKWTEAEFISTLRTGTTPAGKKMDPRFMPWPMARNFTETEIRALYLFLSQLGS